MLDVEELGAGATGAIVFGARERSRGAVLVEDGRVCWIGASGLSRRLTDLLIQETDPPPDRRIVTTLFEECRREGRPLGERLVEAGVVRPEGLRRALLRHSTEALVLLSRDATSRHLWVPHRSQRYDATFTFAPCELATAVAAEVLPGVHAAAAAELDEMLGGEAAGVALDREGEPVGASHRGARGDRGGDRGRRDRAGALDGGRARPRGGHRPPVHALDRVALGRRGPDRVGPRGAALRRGLRGAQRRVLRGGPPREEGGLRCRPGTRARSASCCASSTTGRASPARRRTSPR
ncbi:MAG: hypothetical protein M5U28_19025 [Sandaracinaceae bacterium]|nr:hypothetical protein [Sandaracinaceae bacterium]